MTGSDSPIADCSSSHHRPVAGFRNPWDGAADVRPRGAFAWWVLRHVLDPAWWRVDRGRFQRVASAFEAPRAAPHEITVTWVGHSTLLVQMGGLNVVTDPIWSARASPLPFGGPRRWVPPGISLDALPPVDIVLLSHDHYDHLDSRTVRQLAARWPGALWCAPLGMGRFLRARGAERAAELDWWGSVPGDGARVTCVPARHTSGRGRGDHDRALWCGWALDAGGKRFFFAGDTGWHPDFRDIAHRLGPFDIACLPIGAYAPRRFFRTVHMDPADALRAYRALEHGRAAGERGAAMVPVHWGTFRLTDEPMDEPPRLLRAAWEEAGLPPELLHILAHGETVHLAWGQPGRTAE